jgi:TRAP-type C4-dicarboxylate transport system substrate-binding protein
MLDLGISPIVGATVVSKRTWDRISPADRTKITAIAQQVEKQLQADVPKQDGLATLLMQNQGLKVTKGTGAEWQQLGDSLAQAMRGQMVPADVFDLALKERDAYRQRNKEAAARPAAASAPAKANPAASGASPARPR